jgi:hypothetical protein
MTTRINSDGSCLREIYAKSDSAFLVGNLSRNPYMFHLDSSWQIMLLDVKEQDEYYNIKISKTFNTVAELSTGLQFKEDLRPLVVPVETLQKRFRWFYSCYTFKAVYPDISEKIPVAIDRYMKKEDQKLWFQGDFSSCYGMTGLELNDKMDAIETDFYKWYSKNIYEIYIEATCKIGTDNQYISLLSAAKDSIFEMALEKTELDDILLFADEIYHTIDEYFKTDWFYSYYKANKQQIEDMCEERMLEDLLSKEIEYQLTVPGKIISANTSLIRHDTLIWNISAIRLIPGDYELTASFRTFHPWAFAVVFFLIALSVYCLIKVKKYRKGTL